MAAQNNVQPIVPDLHISVLREQLQIIDNAICDATNKEDHMKLSKLGQSRTNIENEIASMEMIISMQCEDKINAKQHTPEYTTNAADECALNTMPFLELKFQEARNRYAGLKHMPWEDTDRKKAYRDTMWYDKVIKLKKNAELENTVLGHESTPLMQKEINELLAFKSSLENRITFMRTSTEFDSEEKRTTAIEHGVETHSKVIGELHRMEHIAQFVSQSIANSVIDDMEIVPSVTQQRIQQQQAQQGKRKRRKRRNQQMPCQNNANKPCARSEAGWRLRPIQEVIEERNATKAAYLKITDAAFGFVEEARSSWEKMHMLNRVLAFKSNIERMKRDKKELRRKGKEEEVVVTYKETPHSQCHGVMQDTTCVSLDDWMGVMDTLIKDVEPETIHGSHHFSMDNTQDVKPDDFFSLYMPRSSTTTTVTTTATTTTTITALNTPAMRRNKYLKMQRERE